MKINLCKPHYGDAEVTNNLAKYYIDKLKNTEEGLKIHKRAASLGNLQSIVFLKVSNKKKKQEQNDDTISLSQEIDLLTWSYAIYDLAVCYEKGCQITQNFEIAAHLFSKAADLGNIKAFNRLGNLYRDGKGVDKNLDIAKKLYEQACAYNYPAAQRNLGILMKNSNDSNDSNDRNYSDSYLWGLFKEASKMGDIKAKFELAEYYEKQCAGISGYAKRALDLYKQLVKRGYLPAFRKLAYFFGNGIGCTKNTTKSKKILIKLQNLEMADKLYKIACCYKKKNSILSVIEKFQKVAIFERLNAVYRIKKESNDTKLQILNTLKRFTKDEVELFQKAADLGNTQAMNNLGFCYETGIFVEKDIEKAAEIYQKASRLGDSYAYYNLARCIEDHGKMTKKLKTYLFNIYYAVRKSQNYYTINALAYQYTHGKIIKRNLTVALELYNKGIMNEYSTKILRNVDKYVKIDDFKSAIGLYNHSIKYGNLEAVISLALCYYNGKGIKKNLNNANELLKYAYKRGNKNANYPEMDFKNSIQYYRQAADRGCLEALAELSHYYLWGIDVEKNVEKSNQLYKKIEQIKQLNLVFDD